MIEKTSLYQPIIMKIVINVFCILVFLFSCEKSNDKPSSSPPNTNFNHKILDGYFIQSIAIDSKDNIWFNTSAGYAVYDGEKWTVDDTSFRDSGVFAIEQSPDGRIWIGTGDGIYIND